VPRIRKIIPLFFIFAIIILIAGSCFSPWKGETGEGKLIINLSLGSRAIIDPEKIALFEHEIILKGPGGTISRKINGTGTVSIELAAGKWDLKIRATEHDPLGDSPAAHGQILRALGWSNVTIKAGQISTARVDMFSASTVTDWEELKGLIEDVDLPQLLPEEIFVIKGDLSVTDYIIVDRKITIIAESDDVFIQRAFKNDNVYWSFFSVETGGLLKLKGDDGGRLFLDGGDGLDIVAGANIIEIQNGVLDMYDGVILQNNTANIMYGGAVLINNGTFSMYGGTITGNSAAYYGSGVYVGGGSFIMEGGTISGNNSNEYGGGVYVNNGHFGMTGGTISGNNATLYGGGVYVGSSGSFTKRGGGTIYGYDADIRDRNTSGDFYGHAVYAASNSNYSTPERLRNSTAGPRTDLDPLESSNWDL